MLGPIREGSRRLPYIDWHDKRAKRKDAEKEREVENQGVREITSSTEKSWSISGGLKGRCGSSLFLIKAEICLVSELPHLERKKMLSEI